MTPAQTDRDALVNQMYELDGVIADCEKGSGFDAVCLLTIKRVRDAIAALAAQQVEAPAAEPTGYICKWPIDDGFESLLIEMDTAGGEDDYQVALKNGFALMPLYTAPQPGVREGMLKAAEICEQSQTDGPSSANFMALKCAAAIRAASSSPRNEEKNNEQ